MSGAGFTGRENASRRAETMIIPADNQIKPIKPDKRIEKSSVKLTVALAGPTIEMKFNMGCTPFLSFLLLSLRVSEQKMCQEYDRHKKTRGNEK